MSTLRFFRTFVAVARHGSFAEALTQAGVSFQMRALENQLNQRLFERHGRQSVLTQAGRHLLPEVIALLDQYDRLCVPRGKVNEAPVGASFGSIVSCMVPLARGISTLKRVYQRIDIRLYSGKSGELTSLVAKQELDAAIVVEPPRALQDVRWVPLTKEPIVVVTSSLVGTRSVQEALTLLPFLRFDRKEHTGRLVDQTLRKLHYPVNEFLELNSMDTLIDLVRQNIGVTLLPLPSHANWRNDPGLKVTSLPASITTAERRLGLVMRNDYRYPGFAQTFVETCQGLFR
jgi:DNA-binding transcriptional LysR family regulator